MKTLKHIVPLITLGLMVAAFLAGMWFSSAERGASPQHLTLEQILSIRELHVVKHTYSDLFLLHKKGNPNKALRAMVQVPVTVTAYLNLRDIKLNYAGDTLHTIILPRAILQEPIYHVGQLVVWETRDFQIHAGQDLYPDVVEYLGTTFATRIKTARQLAEANHILLQAEAEGKEYFENLLLTLGRDDIRLTFNDTTRDAQVAAYLDSKFKPLTPPRTKENLSKASDTHFGFLPF